MNNKDIEVDYKIAEISFKNIKIYLNNCRLCFIFIIDIKNATQSSWVSTFFNINVLTIIIFDLSSIDI